MKTCTLVTVFLFTASTANIFFCSEQELSKQHLVTSTTTSCNTSRSVPVTFYEHLHNQTKKHFLHNPHHLDNKQFINWWDFVYYLAHTCHNKQNSYFCPHTECALQDSPQIISVAECYVLHANKTFFDCPNCRSSLASYKDLELHYQSQNCTHTHGQSSPLPVTMITLKWPTLPPVATPKNHIRIVIKK